MGWTAPRGPDWPRQAFQAIQPAYQVVKAALSAVLARTEGWLPGEVGVLGPELPHGFGYAPGACCSKCRSQLRLIALIKTEAVAQKILKAIHLSTVIPALHPARPPRPPPGDAGAAMTG